MRATLAVWCGAAGYNYALRISGEGDEGLSADENHMRSVFMRVLHVDEGTATILLEEGVMSLEAVAYMPLEDLLEVKDIERGKLLEIREAAIQCLEERLRNLPRPK